MNLQAGSFAAMQAKILAEKRRAERVESTFSAAIFLEDKFYCHCVVKDVSVDGMRLYMQDTSLLPELPGEFRLKLAALTEVLTVSRAWVTGNHVGVHVTAHGV